MRLDTHTNILVFSRERLAAVLVVPPSTLRRTPGLSRLRTGARARAHSPPRGIDARFIHRYDGRRGRRRLLDRRFPWRRRQLQQEHPRVALVGNWVQERALEATPASSTIQTCAPTLALPRVVRPAPPKRNDPPSPRIRRLVRPIRASCVGSNRFITSTRACPLVLSLAPPPLSRPLPGPLSVSRTLGRGSNSVPRRTRACTPSPSARPPR